MDSKFRHHYEVIQEVTILPIDFSFLNINNEQSHKYLGKQRLCKFWCFQDVIFQILDIVLLSGFAMPPLLWLGVQ